MKFCPIVNSFVLVQESKIDTNRINRRERKTESLVNEKICPLDITAPVIFINILISANEI